MARDDEEYKEWLRRNLSAFKCRPTTFRLLFAEVLEEMDDKEG